MTEQTDAAEVEFWCDECGSETHDTIAHQDYPVRVDWWWSEEGRANALVAAEARGAQAVLAAVEAELSAEEERLAPFGPDPSGLLGNWLGGIRVARDAARAAAAAAGGGA